MRFPGLNFLGIVNCQAFTCDEFFHLLDLNCGWDVAFDQAGTQHRKDVAEIAEVAELDTHYCQFFSVYFKLHFKSPFYPYMQIIANFSEKANDFQQKKL